MHRSTLPCLLLALALPFVCAEAAAAAAAAKKPEFLRATALITNAQNHSAFQCWVFRSPFTVSTTPGTAGAATLDLAKVSNVSYTVIPPHFNGGLHNAPHNQIVQILSGKGVLSLPHSSQTATIHGGPNGLIVATDTMGDGHVTTYPSDESTRALQIPFANGKVPKHFVIRDNGPCKKHEQIVY